ncbi:NAD(P)/FAD-dependent oxidoreductase [Qipengyuania zhejiangensis]|uniref:NAD(P)/FAD-dependent oxidoreductase n=1 Tax=Qipengyuania zhejiangensis TaxID=3077782 RepID=UPI002D76CB03|nr:FAD-binding oxidoreductase [Qipengyuania sp. Z2]
MHDFAIVGAGIAGASLAAELASGGARVLLLEAEDRPGYHSTGRSAAFWEECYGGPEIVPLTLASGPYLRDGGFLSPRGALYIGRAQDEAELDAFMERFSASGATIERLDRDGLEKHLPDLRPEWTGAIWEPACADIDVAGLHAHYLALARKGQVTLECRARLMRAERTQDRWELITESGGSFAAKVLVNAAGAWADHVAHMAGAQPLGIQPLRRTVVQVRVDPAPAGDLPLVLDIAGSFYFKPESGRLWLSPHDEEPSVPCDAAPEELAVAEAVARLEQVTDRRVVAVERKWAGLRSFAPDRCPVYGADPRREGFAWFAGQGGFGIQTSPAAARLAAQVLLGAERDDMTRDLDATLYAPDRFG